LVTDENSWNKRSYSFWELNRRYEGNRGGDDKKRSYSDIPKLLTAWSITDDEYFRSYWYCSIYNWS
jgi:hypothetical protein